MRIGEVAEQTGLSISNIRFYEKKGLIEPEREKQSKYRDYTAEDVRRLKLILLYRKMDISIETIGDLVEKRTSMEAVLGQQIARLTQEQQRLQGSIDLCTKFAEDQGYSTICEAGADRAQTDVGVRQEIDVDAYLNYVKEEEKQGRQFAEVEELLEDFAEFTQYRIIRDSWLGWMLLPYPRVLRLLGVGWCVFWLLFPIVMIVDMILDEGRANLFSIGFWSMWILAFGISFWQFRKAEKARKNKKEKYG